MKALSGSGFLGFVVGGYLSRYVRGAMYWDWITWAVVLGFALYIYAIWKFDNRNEVDS